MTSAGGAGTSCAARPKASKKASKIVRGMFAWNCSESAGRLLVDSAVMDLHARFVGGAPQIFARRGGNDVGDLVDRR